MDTENSTREAEAPAEADIVATTAPAAQPEPIQGQDIDIADDSDSEDSLTFSNGVIEKIVAIAMRDVAPPTPRRASRSRSRPRAPSR